MIIKGGKGGLFEGGRLLFEEIRYSYDINKLHLSQALIVPKRTLTS